MRKMLGVVGAVARALSRPRATLTLGALAALFLVSTDLGAQTPGRQPLGEPPISGPGWTVVLPGVIFFIAALGTWALWRRFAGEDDE